MPARQSFEHGTMYWFPPGIVFVVTDRWDKFADEWDQRTFESIPPDDMGIVPEGATVPTRGFGYIWFNSQPVRLALGYATGKEQSFSSALGSNSSGDAWMFEDADGSIVNLLPANRGLVEVDPPPPFEPTPQPPLREAANWHMVLLPPDEPRYLVNLSNFSFLNLLDDGTVRGILLRPIDGIELPDDVALEREGTIENGRWIIVFSGDSARALWNHICNVAYRPSV